MTGAGSATVAYAVEDSYLGALEDADSDGSTDYHLPFKNPTVDELSLDNALQREPIVQNFEGAATVSGELAEPPHWHDLVFNAGGTGFTSGRMPSATLFFGVDYLSGTSEWAAEGAIVTDATINWQQGQSPTASLTFIYGNATSAASITPSNIQTPAPQDLYDFHGTELTIDGTVVSKPQSIELSIPTNARFHRDDSRTPADAVIGPVNPTLTTEAILSNISNTEAALGGSTPATMLSSVSGSLAFTNDNGDSITYNLGGLKPTNYSWNSLIDPENDLTDPVEFHVSSLGVA
jgi:hypothetical protein